MRATPLVVALVCAACAPESDTAPGDSAESPGATPATLVAGLEIDNYKRAIETLSSFGDRRRGSESYDAAARWVEAELAKLGYAVEHHEFSSPNPPMTLSNTYVTKIGTTSPDEMLIVSAHLDGMGYGGAADDDASGAALVLEAARSFAPGHIQTERSIRFVFWNSEESGLRGSRAYARDRAALQGIESPAGSGRYPEPRWIAMIQHDMLLYDHGLPPGPTQIAAADIDIEYRRGSDFSVDSFRLAEAWQQANLDFSTDYPAEIGTQMSNTDSVSFVEHAAAISVRENRRMAEIGRGSNPHWHQTTDVYSTYSDADFRLGFNAVQMTVGATARLARLR